MGEPLSLGTILTTAALTEGVKFLYGQARDLLRRWRERRDATATDAACEAVTIVLPETVFDGQLVAPQIHFAELDRLAEPLRQLWKELTEYDQGIEAITTSDEKLLKIVDALRQSLEGIYQQRLTFKGEQRPASGPVVKGYVDIDRVFGVVSGVVADTISAGARVRGEAHIGTAEAGADIAAVRAKRIGG